jgi:GT2 family glycosyltransferase
MSKQVVYISDFFANQVLGGAELNDQELLNVLKRRYEVIKINSHLVDLNYLEENKDCFFIISNFINLSYACREKLYNLNYVIYEHDHKYTKKRNPGLFKNFLVNPSQIINFYFYKNANKIICQSEFHKNIVYKNLQLDNIISLGGNLWSVSDLNLIRDLNKNEKTDLVSILDSNIPHKNTQGAISFCNRKKLKYELIKSSNYKLFLEMMSKNKKFIFLPKTPETLSRVVVEARMLGCSVISNQLVGAIQEEWFNLKGDELINYFIEKREEIFNTFQDLIDSQKTKQSGPLVSIVTTFYKADDYLEQYLENITNQTIFDMCELVLVDTASPGKEKQTCELYASKYKNIRYIRFEDRLKPTEGYNLGFKFANGKYICWSHLDDRKSLDNVEVLFSELKSNPHIDLVYGDCLVTKNKNERFQDCQSNTLLEHSLNQFSKENMIKCLPGAMPMFTARMIDKVGFLDTENHDFSDDWEFYLRAVDAGLTFKKVDKIVGSYLEGGRSQMENNLEQRQEEARLFYKYMHLFGKNFQIYEPYFKQFIRTKNDK